MCARNEDRRLQGSDMALTTLETVSEPCIDSGYSDTVPSLSVSQHSHLLNTHETTESYKHDMQSSRTKLQRGLCDSRTIDVVPEELGSPKASKDNLPEDEDSVAPSTIMDELRYLSQLEEQQSSPHDSLGELESSYNGQGLQPAQALKKHRMKSIGIQLPPLEPRALGRKLNVRKATPLRLAPKKQNMMLPVIQQEIYDERQSRLRAAKFPQSPQAVGKLPGLPAIARAKARAKGTSKDRGDNQNQDTLAIPVLGALHVPAHLLQPRRNRSLGRPNPILRQEINRMRRYRSLMRLRCCTKFLN